MKQEGKPDIKLVPHLEGSPEHVEALIHSGNGSLDQLKGVKNKISPEKYIELLEVFAERQETKLEKAQSKLAEGELVVEEREQQLFRANIDPLTGVFIRSFLGPKLEKLIAELNFSGEHRHSAPHAVMVIRLDINNFKIFNEKPYSHAFGDEVLVAFTERLKKSVKQYDSIIRVGGDEFVMVMPILDVGVDFEQVFKDRTEFINKDLLVKALNGDTLHVTASTGYSVAEKGTGTPQQLLEEADAMERKNKQPK